jgi:enoyl-CoA hydratase/carnithine racemase
MVDTGLWCKSGARGAHTTLPLTPGLRLTEEEMGYDRMMTRYIASKQFKALGSGPNLKEGLQAFIEKRAPRWHDPKL